MVLLVLIVPWNDNDLGASPFVAAFKTMGIPYADHIMNAVVLTAVLSCLNSGLYTASRMLFVLAARREAPVQLIRQRLGEQRVKQPAAVLQRCDRGLALPDGPPPAADTDPHRGAEVLDGSRHVAVLGGQRDREHVGGVE